MATPSFISRLKTASRTAWTNLWRNRYLSSATVIVMGLMLFILNVMFVVNLLAQDGIKSLNQKVDLIVYLNDDADYLKVQQLTDTLKRKSEVVSVTYTSKEQALQEFLTKYPENTDPFTQYGIANPIPASIQIITSTPTEQQTIRDFLYSGAYDALLMTIESNEENQTIVNRLINVTSVTQQIIWGLIAALLCGSLLIIINAIHLTIYTRRMELRIMELVGATPLTIRLPFIVEGALYGMIAVVVSGIGTMIFLHQLPFTNLSLTITPEKLISGIMLETVFSIMIGMISSWIAAQRFIRRAILS